MKTWQILGSVQRGGAGEGSSPGLDEAAASPDQSSSNSDERRRSPRYPVHEDATIALCNPTEFVPIQGEIINASPQGLLIRIPRRMHRGAQVYIQIENAAVFGTIRYCRSNVHKTHDIGIAIDQVVMRPGLSAALDTLKAAPAREDIPTPALENVKMETLPDTFEILCVEDNPGDVRLVKMILDEIPIPHHLSVAQDGARALDQLRDSSAPKPDLVLLDLNLPKVSGFEFLERVRSDMTLNVLPVVILSSSATAGDVQRATALGVTAYFQKPADLAHHSKLRSCLQSVMAELAGGVSS